MTISELIKLLERVMSEHGGHIEVEARNMAGNHQCVGNVRVMVNYTKNTVVASIEP